MILINDINDEDDLNNKSITINDEPNASSSSIGSRPNKESNAVSNFINGFKNFIKPKITSTDIEKDNKDISEDASSQMTDSSFSSPKVKEENCRDKIANKIINSIEVERNIGVFVALIGIGALLLIISLFLLPFIITSPKRFSFCFAFGSILVLMSFLFLVGTKSFVTKLMENKRMYISIMFILSIFIGIGFSLGDHYFISLICSIIQFISLIMFVLTFIPGGRAGIDCIKRTLSSPFTKIFINKAKSDLNNL